MNQEGYCSFPMQILYGWLEVGCWRLAVDGWPTFARASAGKAVDGWRLADWFFLGFVQNFWLSGRLAFYPFHRLAKFQIVLFYSLAIHPGKIKD
jgi:hypothetical protein